MPYLTRRRSSATSPGGIVANEMESSSSSEDESSDGEAVVVTGRNETAKGEEESTPSTKPAPITLSLKKVCKARDAQISSFSFSTACFFLFLSTEYGFLMSKWMQVCKGTGHEAGFRGATYVDCPEKPCFLCKMPGKRLFSLEFVPTTIQLFASPRRHKA